MNSKNMAKPKNAPWDPHAHECYSCEFGSRPPRHCPACKGCINRDSRPHWVIKSIYVAAASTAIAKAKADGDAVGGKSGGDA